MDRIKAANKKNRKSIMEIIPSTNGRRVEPKISEDIIKRIQAAEKAKIKKEVKKEYDPDDPTGVSPASNEKKPRGRVKKEKVEKEKVDKGDKSDKSDKEKDGMKQTKLTFKKEPKKKKPTFSGSESEDLSGSDVEMVIPSAPRERTSTRRAAVKVQKYKDGSDDSNSDSEPELLDNKLESDNEQPQRAVSLSDDDDDFNVKKNANKKPAEMDSDCLFDSLIEETKKEVNKSSDNIVESEDEAPKKKPGKRKLMTVKEPPKKKVKPTISLDSDDDSIFDTKKDKKKPAAKKVAKKKKDSSDEESDVLSASPPPRANNRARPKQKYNFSDGSDSD